MFVYAPVQRDRTLTHRICSYHLVSPTLPAQVCSLLAHHGPMYAPSIQEIKIPGLFLPSQPVYFSHYFFAKHLIIKKKKSVLTRLLGNGLVNKPLYLNSKRLPDYKLTSVSIARTTL